MQKLVHKILLELGEDPEREGLRETPRRVEESLKHLTRGYAEDPEETLNGAIFRENYREMVIVRDIDFFSLCEHHLLPFYGKVQRPRKRSLRRCARICSASLNWGIR